MENLTEDGYLQFYTVDQQESSVFSALSRLNLRCWLNSIFLKQNNLSENIQFTPRNVTLTIDRPVVIYKFDK
jgi:hypothetical protein